MKSDRLLIRRSRSTICRLAVLFIAGSNPAYTETTHPIFEHISQEQGLSQGSILCMIQDQTGFIWFGTEDGLNRHDGYAFKVFKPSPKDKNTISHNFIWSMIQDREGVLWIGTYGGGLNSYDPSTGSFQQFQYNPENPESLGDNDVRSIFEDKAGNLWIGTLNGGLNRLSVDSENQLVRFIRYMHHHDDPTSLSHNDIRCIVQDRNGALWIGTAGGGINKCILENEQTGGLQFHHARYDPDNPQSLSHDDVRCMYTDMHGTLWIGTWGGGLNRLIPDNNTDFPPRFKVYRQQRNNPNSISNDYIYSIAEDRYGILWIGTEDGLNKFDPEEESFTAFKPEPGNPGSICHNRIYSVMEDASGVLWFGSRGRGISKWNPGKRQFEIIGSEDELSDNIIWGFYEDDHRTSSTLWVGTNRGGLNKITFNNKTGSIRNARHFMHQTTNPLSISHNNIRSVLRDSYGRLWVGTWGGGLDRYDETTNHFIHHRRDPGNLESLSHDVIITLFEDKDRTLWIGTQGGGLNRMQPDLPSGRPPAFIRYMHDPDDPRSISHNNVYAILQDRYGTMWVGTWGGGLNRLDIDDSGDTHFIHYTHDPGDTTTISHNLILDLHEDCAGNLWIGTSGGGLNKFNRETEIFERYDERHGLPNNVVYGIIEDDHACLWLSTNNGLAQFNTNTQNFKNFTAEDGLQNNEFNGGANYKNSDGWIYFGGINGFNKFHPDSLKESAFKPPVVITNFQVYNRSLSAGDKIDDRIILSKPVNHTAGIKLSHKDQVFSFEFASLDFASPEQNEYAYMLEGLEEDWIRSGRRRYVTYSHIPHGKYTFRAKGTNSDGVWNEEGTAVELFIKPPIWKTWGFRILVIICIGGIIFGWYENRILRIKSQRRLLEEKVVERTHEINEQKDALAKTNRQLKKEIKVRKKAEEMVRSSLKEKEVLLREIHHRVKNNMSVISSLLSLQSKYLKNEEDLEVFRESENRVRMMGLIHEKLYRSRDLAQIDFGQYIRELTNTIYNSYNISPAKIDFDIQVENVTLGVDKGIPCGLVINELVSNALKYAFPPAWEGDGTIAIILRPIPKDGNSVELIVEDNGVGLPADLDIHQTDSLGLKLVSILVEDQLQGSIAIDTNHGTTFKMVFSP